MTVIKVACIQMDISYCNKKNNLTNALCHAKSALDKGAKIIVFPEVFTTGFCYEKIEQVSENYPYNTIQQLIAFSRELECILIGSIIEKKYMNGKIYYYNLGFCIDTGEISGYYRKIHPFTEENKFFTGGNKINNLVTKNNSLTIGLEICYEVRFPEIARKMTLDGADILVTIAEFPNPRKDIWTTLVKARAIENQIPHIACNRIGQDPRKSYFGGSIIIDAEGKTVSQADDKETILIGDINLNETKNVRRKIPVFNDRRPQLY
ncbi:nitrilase-related carbon-nitrogen hydrolase [Methanosalsum natronophilum]|uniref:Carbon-nitrogen family hydrolase n=1 Tax=Methanosalsum natronophilum TaxID=768733 RepID=A0A3R7YEU8_9EURY|nr:nitrilase-related carbon-nitrogen hydrolase [Methanosalsum natronophilum]MCS3924171.1 putative amidohydrolase [Methanosalsum natronophilum]RQD81553.1 MAG: carbon-nitrogen family hydrolase [Methanosalsum natronophilum]